MLEERPGDYRFNPRDDMTLRELIILMRISKPLAEPWFVEKLPADVRRHFDLIEEPKE